MGFLDFLKKGGRERNRQREMLIARVLGHLDHHSLSTIPSILAKIMEVGRNPNATVGDYARLYEMDQSSCMRLLVLANSVYYGARTGVAIRNIEDAIVRVGMRRAQEVINSSVVAGLFKSGAVIEDYSASDLWLNSVAVAVGNRVLYSILPPLQPDGAIIDPYLAGLLHNVGISVEHQCFFQDGFQAAIVARAQNQGLLIDEEMRHLSVTHTEIGMELARRWKLSKELVGVLEHHHDMATDDPALPALLHTTRTAQWIAFELRLGYSDFGEAQSAEYLAGRRAIGVDDATYAKVKDQVAVEIQRLKEIGWFSALKVRRV